MKLVEIPIYNCTSLTLMESSATRKHKPVNDEIEE